MLARCLIALAFFGTAHADDMARLRALADEGDARAQYDLGTAYQQGTAVRRDMTEARRWWRKSAEQGYPPAQFNMGVAYARGDAVRPDREESAKWLALAARQGYPPAGRLLQEIGKR